MALAGDPPVVLFLDDLHWASRATLDVLRYAGRRWAEEGATVLLVLGLRAEATEALPSPADWVTELGHTLPVRRRALDPLAAGETLDLLLDFLRALARENPGELRKESGDEERVRHAFSRAAQTLRSLAGRIDDSTLRADFVGAPRVRRVLER